MTDHMKRIEGERRWFQADESDNITHAMTLEECNPDYEILARIKPGEQILPAGMVAVDRGDLEKLCHLAGFKESDTAWRMLEKYRVGEFADDWTDDQPDDTRQGAIGLRDRQQELPDDVKQIINENREDLYQQGGTEILPLVIDDLRERGTAGLKKYGVPLATGNGRDALRDAYEEAQDLCLYLRQAIEERQGEEGAGHE